MYYEKWLFRYSHEEHPPQTLAKVRIFFPTKKIPTPFVSHVTTS